MESNDPTPAEIRQACERIQATWTEAERRKRCAWIAEAEKIEFPTGLDYGDTWEFVEATE